MTETSISGEPAAPHHVGIAIRAIGFSGMLGGAAGTLLLWGVRTLQQMQPATSARTGSLPVFSLLVAALLGAPALASLATWILTRPLTSTWRRGGFSAVAGGLGLIVLIATPLAYEWGGRAGLLAYAGLCVLICVVLSRSVAAGYRST
jgi:hypothetical protein